MYRNKRPTRAHKNINREKIIDHFTTLSLVFLGSLLGTIYNFFILGISSEALILALASCIVLLLLIIYCISSKDSILSDRKFYFWLSFVIISISLGIWSIVLVKNEETEKRKKIELKNYDSKNIKKILTELEYIKASQDSIFKFKINRKNGKENSLFKDVEKGRKYDHVKKVENLLNTVCDSSSYCNDSHSVPKQE